jgi:hypothetical protein
MANVDETCREEFQAVREGGRWRCSSTVSRSWICGVAIFDATYTRPWKLYV